MMGREIRRVPPNWEHPKKQVIRQRPHHGLVRVEEYCPMYDRHFATAAQEWRTEFDDWEKSGRATYRDETGKDLEFWVYSGNPPDPEYYRPWADEEATWFQLFETVSEGTPVSPPFSTLEELAVYLGRYGDFWDQASGRPGWGQAAAESFCAAGWAPTFTGGGGRGLVAGKLLA